MGSPDYWSSWKKSTNLILVTFHACMATFIAALIITAYEDIATDLGRRASALASPLSTHFRRRPIFLISFIRSGLFNIGCARTNSYTAKATCRVFTAFFICPVSAIGSAVVVETFFKKDRGKYIGIWTVIVNASNRTYCFTIGVSLAPFIFRFVAYHVGCRWFHWILAMIPFSIYEFISPLRMARFPCVVIPACAYAMTVEIPQPFVQKFHFDPQRVGMQFIALIIGSVIGEHIGGRSTDCYFGYLLTICGVVVFLVRIQQAPVEKRNGTPVVGAGIAVAGNQIVTTVLITYAVDCYPDEAGSIGVFVTFVRQIWGFIGRFWLPPMFENVGILNSAGIAVALFMAISFVPTLLI
ncbi:major facilitator superfamily domain-containing protein [Clohesyomyces aquaticus]|uniref:Major facilitator superfamily domain-containing protein n=1 Tax=Clohesyomyces aquaticus TaxID=1231657 RepID=A0A1Y1ZKF8_9PLEO|nr:major facilitator superfamily domain-containing protein [Clohesyomyces aquaticus]